MASVLNGFRYFMVRSLIRGRNSGTDLPEPQVSGGQAVRTTSSWPWPSAGGEALDVAAGRTHELVHRRQLVGARAADRAPESEGVRRADGQVAEPGLRARLEFAVRHERQHE